jgi:hypothetical protein
MEKFEFEEMRDHLIKKIEQLNLVRYRSKHVECLGETYFQPMTDSEWSEKRKRVWIKVENVKSHKQLEDFIAKATTWPIDIYENVHYRMYLIPDFENGQSVWLMNHNHCSIDGVSLWA